MRARSTVSNTSLLFPSVSRFVYDLLTVCPFCFVLSPSLPLSLYPSISTVTYPHLSYSIVLPWRLYPSGNSCSSISPSTSFSIHGIHRYLLFMEFMKIKERPSLARARIRGRGVATRWILESLRSFVEVLPGSSDNGDNVCLKKIKVRMKCFPRRFPGDYLEMPYHNSSERRIRTSWSSSRLSQSSSSAPQSSWSEKFVSQLRMQPIWSFLWGGVSKARGSKMKEIWLIV